MSVDFNWPELREAKEKGLTYGKYRASTYDPSHPPQTVMEPIHHTQKKYSDQAAFQLWQEGKTDAEIAEALGVSRALIQRWRDTLELPSILRHPTDTKKYRLQQAKDGTYFAIIEDYQTISAKPMEKREKK